MGPSRTFLVVLLLALVAPAAPAQWLTFRCDTGRFEVQAPGQPANNVSQNDTPLGAIQENTFRWTLPGTEWVVSYSDVPEVACSLNGGPLFAQVRRGFERTSGNPVENLQPWSYGDYPGRAFEFHCRPEPKLPHRKGVARTFLAGCRLFVLTTAWDGPMRREEGERFFQSFRLAP